MLVEHWIRRSLFAQPLDQVDFVGGQDKPEHAGDSFVGLFDKRGKSSETRADREIAYLSAAFQWGRARGIVVANPCEGLRRFNPEARIRYVTDEEYQSRIELARGRGRHDVVAAMELAYLCRMRMGEIVKMRADQVGADGLLVKRTKGSKTQRVEWSARLQDAVRLAQDATRRAMTAHLLVSSSSGLPLTLRALQGAWNQLRKIAQDRGEAVDWTFHDIKAKGVSDFDGDKHLASGHKTQRMTAVYNRVPDKVGSTR